MNAEKSNLSGHPAAALANAAIARVKAPGFRAGLLRGCTGAALLSLGLIASGCAPAPESRDSAPEAASSSLQPAPLPPREASPTQEVAAASKASELSRDAKFLVAYGGRSYRVNVRYVGIISKMVVVVRESRTHELPGWHPVALEPGDGLQRLTPSAFSGPEMERMAGEIASLIAARPEPCGNTAGLTLEKNSDGEASRLYRRSRQAWVFFARCKTVET